MGSDAALEDDKNEKKDNYNIDDDVRTKRHSIDLQKSGSIGETNDSPDESEGAIGDLNAGTDIIYSGDEGDHAITNQFETYL